MTGFLGLTILSLATATGSIGIAGMICSAYPFIPLLVGVFLLKERLALSQFLGCILLGMGLAGEAVPGP
jgi:drug/metabolite transporter (DMT)-like permease